MRKLKRFSIAILLLALLLMKFELNAQTQVSGIQSGTWESDKSPYIVTNDIIIPRGLVLKIEPGVIIKFARNYRIAVKGALIAQGDEKIPVVFTSIHDKTYANRNISTKKSPRAGDWQGIEFFDECDDYTTVMNHCIIRYSNWCIHCSNCFPVLTNITFEASGQQSLIINNSKHPFDANQVISPITPKTRPTIAALPEPVQRTDLEKLKRKLQQQQIKIEQMRLKALQDSIRLANKVKPICTSTGKIKIDNQFFDELSVQSINELISYLPGFLNIATIWTGSQVTSRGVSPNLPNNRFLYKFNDTPFYESIAKTSYPDFIPLYGIEAIEIERGIGISQFNHIGIAGSVNIVPQNKTSGFVNKSQLELGTFGTKKLSGLMGINRDATSLNLAMNFKNNAGYWRTFSGEELIPMFRQKYADDLYNLSLFLKHASSDLFVSYFESDQFQLGLVPQFQYTNPIKRHGLFISLNHTLEINSNLQGKITTSYMDTYERSVIYNHDLAEPFASDNTDYFITKGKLFTVSVLSQYEQPRYLATVGLTLSRFFVDPLFQIRASNGETIHNENWNTRTKIAKYENTGYLRFGYNITPFFGIDGKTSLHITELASQPDLSAEFKIIFNPFMPFDTYLKYSVASRSATLIERYIDFPGLVRGNAELNSEKFANLEWCTDIHLKKNFKLGITLYHSKNRDIIGLAPGYQFENDRHTYQVAGAEMMFQGNIFNRTLLLSNISYDHLEDSIWSYPQLKFNTLANIYWFQNFSTIIAFRHLSKFQAGTNFGPYYLLNLSLVYQIFPRVKIALKGFDLLDQHPGNPEYIRGEITAIPAGPGRCFIISTIIE